MPRFSTRAPVSGNNTGSRICSRVIGQIKAFGTGNKHNEKSLLAAARAWIASFLPADCPATCAFGTRLTHTYGHTQLGLLQNQQSDNYGPHLAASNVVDVNCELPVVSDVVDFNGGTL